ncbi:response regulator [Algoriphagus sp.]|uniref:response regulator n=1 Tax=Algoriphagus sp. TaxID=1872435 RepID=UPI003288F347
MKKLTQILLIDDDPIINFVHTKIINRRFPHIPLVVFENGLEGLNYIQSHPSNSYLVFLDLNMPKMNGWEFLKAISLDEHELDFQVHIVTSSVDPEDREAAQKNENVQSFLKKPLKDEDLEKIILPTLKFH